MRGPFPIYRIEDAFIRSVALGSGFSRPYSLGIDSRRGYILTPGRGVRISEYIIPEAYYFYD